MFFLIATIWRVANIVAPKRIEHLDRRFAGDRMAMTCGNFRQRDQDKIAFRDARMRQDEIRLVNYFVFVIQNIKVYQPRAESACWPTSQIFLNFL